MITPRLLTTIFMFTTFFSYSQRLEWEKSYGGKHSDYLFDAIATPDYGFILAGSSLSEKTGNKTDSNRGDLDFWIWKMDEHGQLDWQKNLGGSGMDLLRQVVLTPDGGFLLAGFSNSNEGLDKKENSRGQSDFWMIKLNAKGGEEWQRTIGGSGQDDLTTIVCTRDGGFVVGGSSASGVTGEKTTPHYGGLDYWVMKLDNDGKIVWQLSFGGKYNDELRSIAITEDGGFLLGGSSNSPESGNKTQKHLGESDYWIVKLDKDGEEQWQKTIGNTGDDQMYFVQTTKDGHYLLGGNSNSVIGGDKQSNVKSGTDFWIVKLDKDTREILWQETYTIGKVDALTAMVENDDRTILLGGYTQGEIMKDKKLNSLISNSNEEFKKMKKGTADYVVIKLNEKGEELWRRELGSDGEDILKEVIISRDGGYLLAGTSKGGPSRDRKSVRGSNDFWVVKLKDEQKPEKEKVSIEAVPNPTTQFTNVLVGYDYEKGMARVYDIAGRQLQEFEVSNRMIPVDLRGLPEGIYIIEVKTDISTDAVKVIKGRE